jgi:FkbM family methyltransferase
MPLGFEGRGFMAPKPSLKRRWVRGVGLALLCVACAIPFPALAADILGTAKKLYSQWDEELIIRDFFQDRGAGFFVDIGCSEPIKGSTTYYLEKHLGWSGIGVDARAELAPLWLTKRRKSQFFAYIVTDHSGTEDPFYVIPGGEAISSTRKQTEFMGHPVKSEERKVPTITLNDLLERNKVTKIDFLSIDIEGSELHALEGFDIDRFKPELICVEIWPDNRDKLFAYFAAHGYERIDKYRERDIVNWYFRPKEGGPE